MDALAAEQARKDRERNEGRPPIDMAELLSVVSEEADQELSKEEELPVAQDNNVAVETIVKPSAVDDSLTVRKSMT